MNAAITKEVLLLTDDQVIQYREDGYLVFESLILGERLAWYKQVFDELVAEGSRLTGQMPHWSLELNERGEPQGGLCCTKSRAYAWSTTGCWNWRANRRL